MRTAAQRVHVLTLPFENSMAVRRRTFNARANEFGAISADDFFAELQLILKKGI